VKTVGNVVCTAGHLFYVSHVRRVIWLIWPKKYEWKFPQNIVRRAWRGGFLLDAITVLRLERCSGMFSYRYPVTTVGKKRQRRRKPKMVRTSYRNYNEIVVRKSADVRACKARRIEFDAYFPIILRSIRWLLFSFYERFQLYPLIIILFPYHSIK